MAKTVLNKVLDISSYQGILSADAVKKIKDSGVGVIIRMGYTGYGSLAPAEDTCFSENYKSLHNAGVNVGTYYFTLAYNYEMADKEIAFILNALKNRPTEYPFYLDCEGQTNSAAWTNLSGTKRAEIAAYILQKIQDAGYYVGIYSSKSGFSSKWLDMSKLTAFDKWVAQYNVTCTWNGVYGMWQYSSKEKASKYGITKSQYVDINNQYYDFPSIIKSRGLNGYAERKSVVCPKCGEKIYLD